MTGASSADSSSPSLRLLRGVKAAGGADGARRLEALARRLPAERAALEAAAAAGAAEAREWRAAAAEQAAAVLSLAQVGGLSVSHDALYVYNTQNSVVPRKVCEKIVRGGEICGQPPRVSHGYMCRYYG